MAATTTWWCRGRAVFGAMGKSPKLEMAEELFRHPLLKRLCELAARLAKVNLLVVFPKESGWGQVNPHRVPEVPDFCSLIRGSKEGEKHCRMCHILMAVAACGNKAMTEQTCHAGASVLAVPMSEGNGDCIAILSSCTFTHAATDAGWQAVRTRAKKLGLDTRTVRRTFDSLPRLTNEQIAAAGDIMAAAADTVGMLIAGQRAQQELADLRQARKSGPRIQDAVETELRAGSPRTDDSRAATAARKDDVPAAIRVVAALVDRKPNMPFSVAEVAAAARMSPNHFSSLFRKHQKQSFSEYLTQKRIQLAKEVLADLTLNITEVARAVGYDDPGYFARRFKQQTGKTPRAWRAAIGA